MKLLFLSNFYPPADRGGYEQWCQEVADAFKQRGHQVIVVTSRYGLDGVSNAQSDVQRVLYLESDLHHYAPLEFFRQLPKRDRENAAQLKTTIAAFQPDVIFVWGMWQLNPQLAVLAEDLRPDRVGYYFCGFWPLEAEELDPHTNFWQRREDQPWKNLLKRPIAALALNRLKRDRARRPQLSHIACVSQAVLNTYRQYGRAPQDSRVIYGGIDLDKFYRPLTAQSDQSGPLRLLFAGSVTRDKGVDTAIEALAQLAPRYGSQAVHLTVVGRGHPAFEAELRAYVSAHQLEQHVAFRGWVPKEQMPQLIRDFDVLLFTSRWQEPLARMMMEGMAAGLILVSTTTGGSQEFLVHGHNSLTFKAGDAADLAAQIERLLREPQLGRQLALAGQRTALDKFDFKRMVEELESFASELC